VSNSSPGGKRGPNDPARRQRIIEAAARVIADRGVEALTFRAVAKVADVPLGSTTYYFSDKEELLLETLRTVRDRNLQYLQELLSPLVAEHGLGEGLAAMIEELSVRQRPQLVLEYGLYVGARNQQTLKSQISEWTWEGLLKGYCDEKTARFLSFTIDGILLQSVVNEVMFFAVDVAWMFRRITEKA
jgi:TetR/AcrR family transcriptional regulator, regulator of biofilm formation and stress response